VNANSHRFLHVANGTSTTRTIEAAGIPGATSIWADPLHAGPVPPGLSDEQLLEVRARFLARPGETPEDAIAGLQRWRAVILEQDYDELVLWYEHDLFDQLNLIQLLTWIRPRIAQQTRVSLICIGSFPGRPNFKGLGELSTSELAPLLDTRHRVEPAEYDVAERAWQAFREPTPEPLDDLRRSDTAAMPFLASAVHRFLQEYPWTGDGLSRSERQLLRIADRGTVSLKAAFPRMQDGEHAYYTADGSLMELAARLSSTSPPLVAWTGSPDHILSGVVTLTDAGGEVLRGVRDRVTCGLDLWLGGVHLRDGSRIWRWDESRQRIV